MEARKFQDCSFLRSCQRQAEPVPGETRRGGAVPREKVVEVVVLQEEVELKKQDEARLGGAVPREKVVEVVALQEEVELKKQEIQVR